MRIIHVVLSSLMLSLGIGCMVAAGPSGGSESEGAGDVATESTSGEELVGESSEAIGIGVRCGGAICGPGTYCCNASCGICAPKGGACTQQVCEPVAEPIDPKEIIVIERKCGKNVCGKDEFCCNPSCGTCAPRGGACTQQICPALE